MTKQNRQQATGNRQQATGNRQQATGNRQQATGNRQQDSLSQNGKPNWENCTLFINDNLPILRGLNSATVDLIYLDPPFNSKKEYKAPIGTKAEGQMFNDTWRWTDLDDRWLGEIDRRNPALSTVIHASRQTQGDGTAAYLTMMGVRLLEMHRVLKPTGSIYLHCDPTASHYLKACMDAIFGKDNFRNEIVWKRTGAHNSARRYGPIHDIVLFYSGGGKYVWNKTYQPYDKDYVERIYCHKDTEGRRYSRTSLTGPGTREGSSGVPWNGYNPTMAGRHWALPSVSKLPEWFECPPGYSEMSSQERLDVLDAQGLIYSPEKKGGVPLLKRYLSVAQGVPIQDIFTDIDPISGGGSEHTGWATQKPLALLQRIIKASSNPGDVVLDPFAGCATCCEAAEIEGRQWVGIEACEEATKIVRERLDKADLGSLGTQADANRKVTIQRNIPRRTDDEGIALAKEQKTKAYKTEENMNELYGNQRGDCNGCGEHLRWYKFHFDHIIPQSQGGSNEQENLQLLCGHCNSTKSTNSMEFLWERLNEKQLPVSPAGQKHLKRIGCHYWRIA